MMRFRRTGPASFTLVEILVVITIIGLLAGLAVPAVGGALRSAKKAKVAAMAHQVRTAIVQFNTEYGFYPTNGMSSAGIGNTATNLALILTGQNTNDNPRRIAFLEVPNDFTFNNAGNLSNRGLVTPRSFYKTGQSNLSVSVDSDYNGEITVTNDGVSTTLRGASVAVWFVDPSDSRKTVGTWK